MFTVYKTTNQINNKFYIGVHRTNDPFDEYLGSGNMIKRSIKKYGKENFKKEILAIFDNHTDAYNEEKRIVTMELLKSEFCYNLCVGGQGGRGFMRPSEETRAKISKSLYGKIPSQETRNKIGKAHKGKITSEETRAKISKANIGKIFSEESKQKMKIGATKRKPISEETRAKMRESHKGHSVSKETREAISKARLNRNS